MSAPVFVNPGFVKSKASGGFTLLETVITLSVLLLVTGSATGLLLHSSRQNIKIYTETELLENARIAHQYLTEFIRAADELRLTTRSGSLRSLKAIVDSHPYSFDYNSGLDPQSPRYRRLEFSGNELASYIENVTVTLEDGLLSITVATADRLNPRDKIGARPVVFTVKADVSRKKVIY